MAHYTIDIDVKTEDFDQSGKIRADRILSFFQTAAEGQVTSLGVGPSELLKKDLIWVVTKMKVRYTGEMKAGEKYVCTTFPASQKRATFKRDYYINYASDGADPDKAIVIGASQWCILNHKTRKLEKTDIGFTAPEDEINMMDGRFPKIHGENVNFITRHQISENDLDYNDHCNNARYISLSEEATGRNVSENLYVNFASEARLGDEFDILVEEQEEGTYVEGRRADGTIVYQLIMG